VAKLVAEAHGGSLELASPGEDKGTTVTVRLPL
jgi:signal transduction histidine kinase